MEASRRAYLDSLNPEQRQQELKKERKIQGLRFLILNNKTESFNDLYLTLNIFNISH